MGAVIISTDEYKELLQAQHDCETHLIDLNIAQIELENAKEDLKDLLLMLTKGIEKTAYSDGIHSFEIEMDDKIAKYLNENYIEDGKVLFERKYKDEQSF